MGEDRAVRSGGATSAGPQPGGGGGMAVGKQTRVDALGTAPQGTPTAGVERLIYLLKTTHQRPDEQMDEAYAFLAALDLLEMLATMSAAADRGYLPALQARANAAAWFGRARIVTALGAVELSHAPTSNGTDERLQRTGAALDQLPQAQQLQVLSFVVRRNGIDSSALFEGVIALREQERAQGAGGAHAAAPAQPGGGTERHAPAPISMAMAGMAPLPPGMPEIPADVPTAVEPGPWAPPGKEPGGLYVGNEVHEEIAKRYVLAHPGETVIANHFPISSVFRELRPLGHSPNAGAVARGRSRAQARHREPRQAAPLRDQAGERPGARRHQGRARGRHLR